MAGYIPEDILEEIRDRVDIGRLIGEYVPLKRAGRSLKGLCPFHKEKTPSFFVNPERQLFKCFGCNESGNVFTFLMKYEGITFQEAVERLAKMAGVILPENSSRHDPEKNKKFQIYDILFKAYKFYQWALAEEKIGTAARQYLARRGIDMNLAKEYGLGFAPDSWDFLIRHFTRKKVSVDILIDAGLVQQNPRKNTHYDRLRHRILFPIREFREGRIAGFGGRTLGDDSAKYLNTPETPVYHKGRLLYGLYEGVNEIRRENSVFIVEGYFDRIAMSRAGFNNTVAPCGTSLTKKQIKLLQRSSDKIYFLFDADMAGISAAQRGLELCLAEGIDTYAIPLPDGKDPDDILRENGRQGIADLISKKVPALDFIITVASKRYELNTSRGRRNAVEAMMPFLMDVPNSIDRGSYITRIAEIIEVPPQSVMELLKRYYRRNRKGSPHRNKKPTTESSQLKSVSIDSSESDLFLCLLHSDDAAAHISEYITQKDLITEPAKIIYDRVLKCINENGSVNVSKLLDQFDDEEFRRLISDLAMIEKPANRLFSRDYENVLSLLRIDFQIKHKSNDLAQNKKKIRERDAKGEDSMDCLNEQVRLHHELKALRNKQTKLWNNLD